MKLKIIKFDGEETEVDCEAFEFRTNHVTNWIEFKSSNQKDIVYDVCVIKSIN